MTIPWILGVALKGAVLLFIAWLAARALARAPAALRHLVWSVAALGLFLVPFLDVALPGVGVPVLPPTQPRGEPVAPADLPRMVEPLAVGTPPVAYVYESEPAPVFPVVTETHEQTRSVALPLVRPAAPTEPFPWVPVLWLTGALLALLPYGTGVLRLRGLVRRARHVGTGAAARELVAAGRALPLDTPVRLLESDELRSPATCGWRRPVVLLPREAREWPRAQLRLVFLHELAHIRRRDWLVECASRLALAMHWFDPLAWLALRGVRRESERACDDQVLLAGEGPADYADCLLDVARGPVDGALLAMARPGRLEVRLRAVLQGGLSRRMRRGAAVGALLLTGATVCLVGVLHATERAHADEETVAYDVALEGNAPFRTVQAAVDAAEAGAEIRIGPGTYDGQIEIRKTVTLIGAGPERTILTGRLWYSRSAPFRGASPDDRVHPVVLIEDAREVILRDLGLTSRLKKHSPGGTRQDAVLLLRRSDAILESCAIRETAANAAIVGSNSSALFHRCLLGPTGSKGLVIRDAKVHIRNCDVRDCYHYGISIGAGSDVRIDGCRISGSLWHGIRYDHCSPTIRGNVIFDNARSGIYASGKTAALVEGNLFLHNILSGISCWFANEDVIHRNTFVGNVREAVAVLGVSEPTIEKNVFAKNGTAVRGSNIGGESDGRFFAGPLLLKGNWFWNNEAVATIPSTGPDPKPLTPVPLSAEALAKGANVEADPGFADPVGGDFALGPDTPAGKAGVGAAALPRLESPWPMTDAEKVWHEEILAGLVKGRPRSPATPPAPGPRRSVGVISADWVADLHSLTDVEKRARGAAAIRAALEGDDPLLHHAAFQAITRTGSVAWNKTPLRDLVLARLATAEGAAQKAGFYALYNVEGRARPEDVARLLAALEEPSEAMRVGGSHLLHLYTGGRLEGAPAQAILRLLASDDRRVLREVMRGIWGARVGPPVEERLLEIAATDDPGLYHDAIYFALSTLNNKSKNVVAELGRAAEHPDHNVSGRAAWGLAYGVLPEAQDAAADVLLQVYEHRKGGQDRSYARKGLSAYGGQKHLDALAKLMQGAALDTREKAHLESTMQSIRNRLAQEANAGPEPVAGIQDPTGGNPWTSANSWLAAYRDAEGDEAKRRARRRIQGALHGDDRFLRLAALCAYPQLDGDIPEAAADRKQIRALLPTVPEAHYETALRALARTGPEAEDVDRALAYAATIPAERVRLATRLIVDFVGRDVDGKAADTIVALLQTDDPQRLEDVLIELQGIRAGPTLEARLLELADTLDASLYHTLVRCALSRIRNMSPAVTQAVLRATTSDHAPTRTTAIYGLQKGEAAPTLYAEVADRMWEIFDSSDVSDDRAYAIWALAIYGDASHLEKLRSARERDDLSPTLHKHVEEAIRRNEARAAR